MNDQNQSADMVLSICINLEMPVVQKMVVEQRIHFLEINGFASLVNVTSLLNKEHMSNKCNHEKSSE